MLFYFSVFQIIWGSRSYKSKITIILAFMCTYVVTFTSVISSYGLKLLSIVFLFQPRLLSVFHRAGPQAINSPSFCLSWNITISCFWRIVLLDIEFLVDGLSLSTLYICHSTAFWTQLLISLRISCMQWVTSVLLLSRFFFFGF